MNEQTREAVCSVSWLLRTIQTLANVYVRCSREQVWPNSEVFAKDMRKIENKKEKHTHRARDMQETEGYERVVTIVPKGYFAFGMRKSILLTPRTR